MLRFKDDGEKIQIVSIPIIMFVNVIFFLLLQIGFIIYIINALSTRTIDNFLGLDWTNRILNLSLYILPTLIAAFLLTVLPIVKTEIKRSSKIVSIKPITPFHQTRSVGFDYIKNGMCSNVQVVQDLKFGDLYFEIRSGERINVIGENNVSRKQILEIIEKVNILFDK